MASPLRAAAGCAARAARVCLDRLRGAYECGHEAAVDLPGERVDIEPGFLEEYARVLDLVDSRRLDVGLHESRFAKQRLELGLFERACDAAHPQLHAAANLGRYFATHDDVGNGEAAARLQHT